MTVSVAHVDRDHVMVTGSEALAYLHSQVSQRLDDLAVGESRWSFVLQPQGKSEGVFRITRLGDEELLLDCDPGVGAQVSDSIARFKLRTKAEFVVSTGTMIEVRGEGAADAAAAAAVEAAAVVASPWQGPGEAVDVLLPTDPSALPATLDAEAAAELRLRHGMPSAGVDVADAIPNETGLIDLTVSFDKGCYRGQELVERIHARGGNRRELRRLTAADGGELAAGAAISDGEREVGNITSAVAGVALGYVRGDVEPDASLSVGDVQVVVEPLFG